MVFDPQALLWQSVAMFTLNDFTADEWEGQSVDGSGIDFSHVKALHESAEEPVVDQGRFDDGDCYFFLHQEPDHPAFEIYVYSVNAMAWKTEEILSVDPMFWIYGTTFDGVRESSGAPNITVSLLSQADVLTWVHNYACNRWPSFAEWYADDQR